MPFGSDPYIHTGTFMMTSSTQDNRERFELRREYWNKAPRLPVLWSSLKAEKLIPRSFSKDSWNVLRTNVSVEVPTKDF